MCSTATISLPSSARRARELEREPLGEMHHGAVLQVELGLAERGVGDLEDEAPRPGVDEHVLILVGAELADGARDAEALARQRARLLEREARGMQHVPGEADAHAGYGTASSSSAPGREIDQNSPSFAARATAAARDPAASFRMMFETWRWTVCAR